MSELYIIEDDGDKIRIEPVFSITINKENEEIFVHYPAGFQKRFGPESRSSCKIIFNGKKIAEIIPLNEIMEEFMLTKNKKAVIVRNGQEQYTKSFMSFLKEKKRLKVSLGI